VNHIALVVEDDPVCGARIEYWLRQRGWAVERVETGTEGLRRYAELNPGLIITDAILSGMDGIGLCGRIRLQPFAEHVQIGLIAALPEVRDAALAAGADFFLLKPVHEAELAACLERLSLPPTDIPTERDLRSMTPVRVPTLQSEEGIWEEEGPLGMMRLVEMLKNLYERRFSGVLEVESLDGPGRQVKVFFERGYPAVARSSDKSTGFARILEVLGVASPDVLEAKACPLAKCYCAIISLIKQ
jgi:CheY-like chemotaxis protein